MSLSRKKRSLPKLGPLPVFFALVVGLMAWSWQKWAELLVDSGFNFYTFWQLSLGKLLYRDLAYYHGPLSPYIGALLFKVFGVSLLVLALTNAVLVLAITWLIYKIFLVACDRATALALSLFFLIVFAFSQYIPTSNYNYILPYKFEAVHGILLGVLMIYFFQRTLHKATQTNMLMAGLCLGASWLTSMDIASATLLTAFVACVLLLPENKMQIPSLKPFFAGALIFPAFSFLWLATYLPFEDALNKTFNSFLFPLLHRDIAQNIFFVRAIGFDQPLQNLKLMAFAIAGICIGLALLAILAKGAKSFSLRANYITAFFLVLGFYMAVTALGLPWWFYHRALPFFCFAFLSIGFFRLWKRMDIASISLILWGVFSLALISRMLLAAQLERNGFYLAMPATLYFVAFFSFFLPQYFEQKKWNGQILRYTSFGLCLVCGTFYFTRSSNFYHEKTFAVGQTGDTILSWDPERFSEGYFAKQALEWIVNNTPANATLLTLPEGTIFNYLSRRERPGPYTMNMVEFLAHGEEKILQNWQLLSPDYVALIHRDSFEFGMNYFGKNLNYGKRTLDWVHEHYEEVQTFGAIPLQEARFGIQFLKRKL